MSNFRLRQYAQVLGGVAIHLANSIACKSCRTLACNLFLCLMIVLDLKGSTSPNCLLSMVANLTSMNSAQCPELSFHTGGRGCQMISYTPYHMIYTQIRLAIM